MTPKQASNQIKEILDALPGKKTNKEKLLQVFKIKVLLETIEEPLKKRKEKEAAAAAQQRIIKKALLEIFWVLSTGFMRSMKKWVTSTFGKRCLTLSTREGFIKPRSDYTLPTKFGMFSDRADCLVQTGYTKIPHASRSCRGTETLEDP